MESANLYHHHHHHHLLYSSSNNLTSSSSSSLAAVSALHDWIISPTTTTTTTGGGSLVLDGYTNHDYDDEELNRYMTEILPNSSSSSPSSSSWCLKNLYYNYNSLQELMIRFVHQNPHPHPPPLMINHHHHGGGGESLSSNTNNNNNNRYGDGDDQEVMDGHNKFSCSFASSDHYNILAADHFNTNIKKISKLKNFVDEEEEGSRRTEKIINSGANNSSSNSSTSTGSIDHHQLSVTKRPRLSSSSSSSPAPTLKVRKEKLGDRIAALHRMVSPFGKTDTSSVLTEAIGYIQFLQDQIQTLTMSCMKSSRTKSHRNTRSVDSTMKDHHHHHHHHYHHHHHPKPEEKDEEEEEEEEEDHKKTYKDLRSRGLCLVPLSFTSYICSYNVNI